MFLLLVAFVAFVIGLVSSRKRPVQQDEISTASSSPELPKRTAEDMAHAAVSKTFSAGRTSAQIVGWAGRTAVLAGRNIGASVKEAAREARRPQQPTQHVEIVDAPTSTEAH